MQSRPFRLIHDAERAWLATALASACDAWARHWLRDAPAAVVVTTLPELQPAPERLAQHAAWLAAAHGSEQAHVALTPALMDGIAALAFGAGTTVPAPGPAGPSSLTGELVHQALQDLAQRWLANASSAASDAALALAPHPAHPDPDTWRRASGALALDATLGDTTFAAVLSEPLVRAWLRGRHKATRPAQPALAKRRACITGQRVALRLEAGSAEIEIGVLQSLVPGDVITLGSRIDEPLSLAVGGQAAAGRAYLGRVRGRKALLIATTNP